MWLISPSTLLVSARDGSNIDDGVHDWFPNHGSYSYVFLDIESFSSGGWLSFISFFFVRVNCFDVNTGTGEPIVVFCLEFGIGVNFGFLDHDDV